jgi:hypothetical protein
MISALRSTARLFGRTVEQIPADPRHLREGFASVSPAAAGISLGRLDNIRSLVLAALKEADKPVLPGRSRIPLSPAWASLWTCLPDTTSRNGLSRFLSYCTAQSLLPPDVTLATFAAYRDALEHQSLSKKPGEVYRTTCRLWNKAAQTIEG